MSGIFNPTVAGRSTVTTTGNIAQLALPGGPGDLTVRMDNATLSTIQGIAPGLPFQRLTILSVGAGIVSLAHQNVSATAADRLINFVTSGVTMLAAGVGKAEFVYDDTTARWRLVVHEQGAFITPTFAAGDYTAQTGTWTVAGAGAHQFLLEGRVLTFALSISGTTSGTPAYVSITLPNGYTSAGDLYVPGYLHGNGAGAAEMGIMNSAAAAGTTADFTRVGGANFGAGTVYVRGELRFGVN